MTDQPNRQTWREYAMLMLPSIILREVERAENGNEFAPLTEATRWAGLVADEMCRQESERFDKKKDEGQP